MDKALYVIMNGVQARFNAQRTIVSNLSNADTVGFRAQKNIITALPQATSSGLSTRIYGQADKMYTDFKGGALTPTGRDLDIAINDSQSDKIGFIAVQTKEGKEAYTRNGSLGINKDGFLVTSRGDVVLGTGGPISVAEASRISIGEKGGVKGQVLGQTDSSLNDFGQIKLIESTGKDLDRGEDGLFYASGGSMTASDAVYVVPGSLEGSNVSSISELTALLENSRNYDMQMRLMKHMEETAGASNQLFDVVE
jgi:flagellar basal-body rod protein FlgF